MVNFNLNDLIKIILTCKIVVPGSTWTGLSSMKTSNFSGAGGCAAKVRAASGAARAGELSLSALVSGWRSIFCSKHQYVYNQCHAYCISFHSCLHSKFILQVSK